MRIHRDMVIETASRIADERGLSGVSLKAVAQELGIRTPSLYNHIDSLDGLLLLVAHGGMRRMNEEMMHAALGNAGEDALCRVAEAYLEYMTVHPGVYETIQWATWHSTEETGAIFAEYEKLLTTLLYSCGFTKEQVQEGCRILMGLLHGYTTLQLSRAFTDAAAVKKELKRAVGMLLFGMHKG